MKSIIIFILAMTAGVGGAIYFNMQRTSTISSPYAANSAPQQPASLDPQWIRNIGPTETITRVEYCEGRCRCDSYNVTETVARAGIIKASKRYDAGANRSPRCPGINGTHNRAPVPGASGQCYVCPTGMSFSSFMRGGDEVQQRWNSGEPVCVTINSVCAQ
ncbi:MAG: hypothetical protein HKN36_01730 [Hellea sp.]|nr:hypothetical protein [Hellea sp.]